MIDRELLMEHMNGFADENVFFAPDIPDKKLKNAIKAYASSVAPDEVIVLVDDTVWGGARDGLIFTDEEVFCKEMYGDIIRKPFADIKKFEVNKKKIIANNNVLYKFNIPDANSVNRLIGFFNDHVQGTLPDKQPKEQNAENAIEVKAKVEADNSAEFIEKIDKIRAMFGTCKDFYLRGQMSPKQLKNFCKNCRISDPNEILAFLDTTILSSGKDGIAFCKNRIVWRNFALQKPGSLIMKTWENVFFEPWVGCNYNSKNGILKKNILVLADSHYCDESNNCDSCGDRSLHPECSKNFTTNAVKDYLNPESSANWHKTYSRFVNTFFEKKATYQEREKFFNSIVFYNFLQRAAGEDDKSASQYNDCYHEKKNMDALYEVLDIYAPEVVISWGDRLWNILPNDWGYGEAQKYTEIAIGEEIFKCLYIYPYNGKDIQLIGVYHPCSSKYVSDFHKKLYKNIKLR